MALISYNFVIIVLVTSYVVDAPFYCITLSVLHGNTHGIRARDAHH